MPAPCRFTLKHLLTHVHLLACLFTACTALMGCVGPPNIEAPAAVENCTIKSFNDMSSLLGSAHYYLHCKNADHLDGVNITGKFETLTIEGGGALTSLRLVGFPNLISLTITDDQITQLDLTGLPNLKEVTLSARKLAQLSLPKLTLNSLKLCNLQSLASFPYENIAAQSLSVCSSNRFEVAPLLSTITYSLALEGEGFNSADWPAMPNIKSLTLTDNTRPFVLTATPNISTLYLNGATPKQVDVSNSSIDFIALRDTNIETLIASQATERLSLTRHQAETLKIKGENITELSLTGQGTLSILKIDGLDHLRQMKVEDTGLNLLNASNAAVLEQVAVKNSQLGQLIAANNPALTQFAAENTRIDSVIMNNNPQLKRIRFEGTEIGAFEYYQMETIEELRLYDSRLTELELSGFPALHTLEVAYSPLLKLDLSANQRLEYFNLYDAPISTLDLSKNTLLNRIIISKTQLGCAEERAIFKQFLSPKNLVALSDNNCPAH